MQTRHAEASAEAIEPALTTDPKETKAAANVQPAPSMIWMLLPIALLALLAFLSR